MRYIDIGVENRKGKWYLTFRYYWCNAIIFMRSRSLRIFTIFLPHVHIFMMSDCGVRGISIDVEQQVVRKAVNMPWKYALFSIVTWKRMRVRVREGGKKESESKSTSQTEKARKSAVKKKREKKSHLPLTHQRTHSHKHPRSRTLYFRKGLF